MTTDQYLIVLLTGSIIALYLSTRSQRSGMEKDFLQLRRWYDELIAVTHGEPSAEIIRFPSPTFFFSHHKTNSNMVSTTDLATGYSFEYGQPTTPKGNPSPFQVGTVKNTSSDETIATVSKDPDNELKGNVQLTGKMGVYTISTEADADLTEGEAKIYGSFNGEVTASQATGFGAPVIGKARYEGDEEVAEVAPVVLAEEVAAGEPTAAGTVYNNATGAAL